MKKKKKTAKRAKITTPRARPLMARYQVVTDRMDLQRAIQDLTAVLNQFIPLKSAIVGITMDVSRIHELLSVAHTPMRPGRIRR